MLDQMLIRGTGNKEADNCVRRYPLITRMAEQLEDRLISVSQEVHIFAQQVRSIS